MEIYQGNGNKLLKNVGKGMVIALISTFILLFIFSVLLTYTDINENTITPVIMIATGISILIGSTIGNRKLKKNGLLNGAIIGGGYILILYLISSILNWNFSFNLQSIIMTIIGVVFGIIGGIVGVNIK